ncbi:MAG: tRNA (adenosine(37)-N6)-threonylcarbamoyltransferase complex dimerization subunit type 1 TsaB [Omnitrophica bacterium]|nr:tRNA (adenosine(37)-N6)-threonylcarbamoyltransferase complex dimerization subunit type 1 TsaB [Candidatus Omnitrophota bacterium]
MKILGIDTSTRFLSVAVKDGAKEALSVHGVDEFNHSLLLMPSIDKALHKCCLRLKDIDAIALSIGPGSFTGLRIGVAAVKGINLALGLPIVPVPTLDVIAYNFVDEKAEVLCPIIDAKKGKVYTCFYRLERWPGGRLRKGSDYMLTNIGDVIRMIGRETLVFGDGAGLYERELARNALVKISRKEWIPRARVVAELGLRKAKKKQFVNPDRLVPMYLYSKYCQVKNR